MLPRDKVMGHYSLHLNFAQDGRKEGREGRGRGGGGLKVGSGYILPNPKEKKVASAGEKCS